MLFHSVTESSTCSTHAFSLSGPTNCSILYITSPMLIPACDIRYLAPITVCRNETVPSWSRSSLDFRNEPTSAPHFNMNIRPRQKCKQVMSVKFPCMFGWYVLTFAPWATSNRTRSRFPASNAGSNGDTSSGDDPFGSAAFASRTSALLTWLR